MLNYIKSEFYRIFNKRSTYFFVVICSVLLISSNVVLAVVKRADEEFHYATTAFSFTNLVANQLLVYLLCILVSGLIFGNEHGNHTMKNNISYGITRGTIYFGKLIVQFIYAIAAFTIIIGSHVASAYLLLEYSGLGELELLLNNCVAFLPLYLFALAATNALYFAFESNGSAIGYSCGLLFAIPLVFNLLGMKFSIFASAAKVLPYNMINNVEYDFSNMNMTLMWGADGYRNYWIIGILEMCFMIIIGFMIFSKKEIK